jgi:alkanesulfonate monooxygenase SsuD/methylene tetrahydromethanopterin reductase-like flavin-dependent oxidoreductase (luciferase family)
VFMSSSGTACFTVSQGTPTRWLVLAFVVLSALMAALAQATSRIQIFLGDRDTTERAP